MRAQMCEISGHGFLSKTKCLDYKSANSQIRQLRNKISDIKKKIEEQDIKIEHQQALETRPCPQGELVSKGLLLLC